LSTAHNNGRITVGHEVERLYKEAVVVNFTVQFHHTPGGFAENHKNLIPTAARRAVIRDSGKLRCTKEYTATQGLTATM